LFCSHSLSIKGYKVYVVWFSYEELIAATKIEFRVERMRGYSSYSIAIFVSLQFLGKLIQGFSYLPASSAADEWFYIYVRDLTIEIEFYFIHILLPQTAAMMKLLAYEGIIEVYWSSRKNVHNVMKTYDY
jgi:hypothetical protein